MVLQNKAENRDRLIADFRSLSRWLHGNADTYKMTAMFRAYFDDSLDGRGQNISVFAGWSGSEESWMWLIPRWKERLERDGVAAFHMTDCDARGGEYRGWSIDRKNKFVIDLIALVNQADIKVFGAGILIQDYCRVRKLKPEMDDEWLKSPNVIVAAQCMQDACLALDGLPSSEDISFMFDRSDNIEGKITDYFWGIKDDSNNKYGNRMRSIAFADHRVEIPLQVADLAAFELRKYVQNRSERPDLTERKSFAAFKHKIHPDTGRCFNENSLLVLLHEINQRKEQN